MDDLIGIDRVAGWSRGREIAGEIDRPTENDIAKGEKIKTTETSFFSLSLSKIRKRRQTVLRGGKREL